MSYVLNHRRITLGLSGSPTQLNKEARSWRVRSKRLLCVGPTQHFFFLERI
jgi:hypothetical protein